jgi:putative membrane protein
VEEPTQGRVDYRFLLANERTFLAWSRTALALQVAGLGVLQFLTHGHSAVRVLLGVALVAVGSATAMSGYLRYRNNERAIRAGRDLPAVRSTVVLTAVVVALPLLATLVLELF